ncbi:type 1 fimbrial protein [Enterobacter sp. MF024]|uniref:fimbrial protein n=1 Tax=Enterobacter sp. MF024 TaxID=2555644 RepID=UPI00110635AD|nr:fimbrial protein [Enterobacter sp. MF024]TLU69450.1 type 1 fimbrial protein [Enterobacter sp. MF024]
MKNHFRVAAAIMGILATGAAFSNNITTNPGAAAGTQSTGGVVEFSGEIVDNSCDVTTSSKDVKVDLGKWSASYFTAANVETTKTPFKIQIDNCPTSVKTVAVLFDGQKDADDATLLAVAGGAKGVGIKLYNGGASSSQVNLGSVSASVPVASGKATVPFFADYTSTVATVTSGAANGVANFLMVYN